MACWRRRRIDPVAEILLTQSDSSRIIVCAGFVQVWRWVSLASARGSIRRRRQHSVVMANPCLIQGLEAKHVAHVVLVFFNAPPFYEGCYIACVACEYRVF